MSLARVHREQAGGTPGSQQLPVGLDRAAQLLEENLREEKAADEKLTHIAESGVNAHAVAR